MRGCGREVCTRKGSGRERQGPISATENRLKRTGGLLGTKERCCQISRVTKLEGQAVVVK